MTIAKGEPWGEDVERPGDLRVAADDAELARLLADGSGTPTAVAAGDMARTIGARPIGDRTALLSFPIDLVHVRIDDHTEHVAVAHLVVRLPWARGGALRGPVLVVMNAEWIGDFEVAPRGHPNDGRVETLLGDPSLGLRQRLAIRTRLRNASHLPHPAITTRAVRQHDWSFEREMDVLIDGERVDRGRHVSVKVEADAAVLFA
ncbi:MAG: hypothetical protein AB8G26_18640 [Ilumatobacter sp.]